jgi:hypothetical protein
MADLSTLDETQPTGGDAVSGGDDAIRATRAAVKTSFDVEHALTGEHTFMEGTTAARPAAGFDGRIYLNSERTWIERDSGAAWVMANAVAPATNEGSAISLTSSYQVIATAAVTVPTGGRAVLMAVLSIISAGTPSITVRLRSQASFELETIPITVGSSALAVPIIYLDPTPTPGAVSYTVEAKNTAASATAGGRLIVLVL